MEGADQSDLRGQRIAKLRRLRDRGVEPFAINFERTHTITEAIEVFLAAERTASAAGPAETIAEPGGDDAGASTPPPDVRSEPVALAGRLMRHRAQGKAGFGDIVDLGGKIQLYVRVDHLGAEGMDLFDDLDLGDIVGVRGPLFRTRRGEVSVEVEELTMLTKALRPLPDKWHGLKDPETRYRQRHVDLIVNRDVSRVLTLRSRLISHLRRFLDGRGFIEVEIPVLHKVAGGAAARPFLTHHNALDVDLKLRIALELHLKRLVVGGLERVYEIGRVFRNEGVDATHNPEFTMLELYQAYTDLEGMADIVEAMLQGAAGLLLGAEAIEFRGTRVDISGHWPRLEMRDLVSRYNPGVDVDSVEQLRARALELGAIGTERLGWGEALYELFERSVEDQLISPTFVIGFPAAVSPLARRRADDPRLVHRFEMFIHGQELANAFAELTDPIDQRARFEEQLLARAAGDDEAHPMDEEFIAALEQGMPPTGGLGVGIDRLVMLFADVAHIRDVIAFPLMRDAQGAEAAEDGVPAEPPA